MSRVCFIDLIWTRGDSFVESSVLEIDLQAKSFYIIGVDSERILAGSTLTIVSGKEDGK